MIREVRVEAPRCASVMWRLRDCGRNSSWAFDRRSGQFAITVDLIALPCEGSAKPWSAGWAEVGGPLVQAAAFGSQSSVTLFPYYPVLMREPPRMQSSTVANHAGDA